MHKKAQLEHTVLLRVQREYNIARGVGRLKYIRFSRQKIQRSRGLRLGEPHLSSVSSLKGERNADVLYI